MTIDPEKTVIIAVRGGIAYEAHVPAGITLFIADFDNDAETDPVILSITKPKATPDPKKVLAEDILEALKEKGFKL